VDGAILQAQMGMPLAGVLEGLRTVVRPVFSV
jgi:hypothetical protein